MSAATSRPTGRRRTRYRYSPALDGVRGTAMVLFMAFHFGATWLQGAWVGINLFFVLSAFLIVRLLVEERVEWGRIDVLAFYRRRARRLLPALFLLLVTLGVVGVSAASDTVRRPLRGDILATLCYVQNWHLITRNDQYFQQYGNPSLLRHAWTLAVEEQFYLVAPLLVAGLLVVLRRRWMQACAVLALGVVSAIWTAHIGVASAADQPHAYYGTDTRAQALCIGAALGLWAAPRPRGDGRRRLPKAAVQAGGWLGLASVVYSFIAIEPFSPWMFDRGGMYVFALGAALLVLACVDDRPSLLQRILGWKPFAYAGRRSYGLYLWHWPVAVWMHHSMPGAGTLQRCIVGTVVTFAVAVLSYRWIELPVMRGGVRALVPSSLRVGTRATRTATAVTLVVILGLSFTVGQVPSSAQVANEAARGAVPLVTGQPSYKPRTPHIRVALLGDSVTYYMAQRFPQKQYPDMRISNLAVPGCDMMNLPLQVSKDRTSPNQSDCMALKKNLGSRIRAAAPDVLVIFWGSLVAAPHAEPDGHVVTLADPKYRAQVVGRLNAIRATARRAGVKQIQVVTVPCRTTNDNDLPANLGVFLKNPQSIVDAVFDPVQTNAVLTSWAHRHDAPTIDLYGQLCRHGYVPKVHDVELYDDGEHFSLAASVMIWTWLAPQIRTAYAARGQTTEAGS